MSFAPAPPAKSPLGVYRLLSPLGSVRVSPLCLGGMSIGESWSGMMGKVDKRSSFDLLDKFYELGGNFIDTASNYQEGESERYIGEWMEERGNRDQIVLATKFSTNYVSDKSKIRANYAGNSRKTLHVSVKDSLKKLRTDYIDILYVHWWDYTTSVEDIMPALDSVVRSGKVLYLGISDAPAWVVSKANTYAKDHNLTPFVVYQGLWNVAERDLEREIVPMCLSEGIALTIWGSLGGGKFKTPEQIAERAKGEGRTLEGWNAQSPADIAATAALDKIAKEIGSTITSVALAYVILKAPYVFPITGGRTIQQLEENVNALKIALTPAQIKALDDAVPLTLGFPYKLVGTHASNNFMLNSAANYAYVEPPKAIQPK